MSRKGRAKKAARIAKSRESRAARELERGLKEAIEHSQGKKKLRETPVRTGRDVMSGQPPWKRKILEALKKREQRGRLGQ